MVQVPECAAWTWDARPYPFFPALTDVWTDGANWRLGHWLTGRLGAVSLAALVRHLCLRTGMAESRIDVSGLWGAVEGYAIGALESPRASITTLSRHFGFDAVETEGMIRFIMRGRASVATLAPDDLVAARVQLSVLDRDLTAPPASPTDGDRYIVGSGATGDWVGWDLNVALFTDGAWLRLPPRTGWRAWIEDEGLLLVHDGAGWIGTTPAALQNLALLGIGTTADASNPFSAKLNAALWTAKIVFYVWWCYVFYTMNKEAAGDDLGLTLQTGFVTKALVGLFGSDRFRLAVSADGSTFFDGLSVDNANGIVDHPRRYARAADGTTLRSRWRRILADPYSQGRQAIPLLCQPDRAEAWCWFVSGRPRARGRDRGGRVRPASRRVPPARDRGGYLEGGACPRRRHL